MGIKSTAILIPVILITVGIGWLARIGPDICLLDSAVSAV